MITIADPVDLDALRIRHEFLSLPGLQASVEMMAARLGVNPRHAQQMLDELVAERFLDRAADGRYVRNAATS
jgi:DNA-binding IclR family transcriptional regulator